MPRPTPPVPLPEGARAVVDVAKVRDYLLSHEHPVGSSKATFFANLGYFAAQWSLLQEDLLTLGSTGNAEKGASSRFGRKYVVRGTLKGPSGRTAKVVTVWLVLNGEVFPRFVTAYPG